MPDAAETRKEPTISKDEMRKAIATNPSFYSLSENIITAIADLARVVECPGNNIVFREGDPGDSFYLILDGHVEVLRHNKGEELVMSVLDPGDVFGEVALLVEAPRSASIRSADDCRFLKIKSEDFFKLMRRYPPLLVQMNKVMGQRVSLLDVASDEVTDQLRDKFRGERRVEHDPSVVDRLFRLNKAAGGKALEEHCRETASLAREMSKVLCPMLTDDLFLAGYLHEIGMIGISPQLVEKQRKGAELAEGEEMEFSKVWKKTTRILHPDKQLFKRLRFIAYLGEDTFLKQPLEAQILRVAHDYLVLVAKDYLGMSREDAMQRMKQGSGTTYNPRVVLALEKTMEKFLALKSENQLNFVKHMNLALDVKDNYTLRHSYGVKRMGLKIGEKIGLTKQRLDLLEKACDMHDVGKIYIPIDILNAPRKLSDEEMAVMQLHPVYSAEFFEDIPGMEELAKIIRHHHERFDGRGYPEGLKGEQIPLLSRIEVVADVYSALTTPRVYRLDDSGNRKAFKQEEALEIMHKMQPGHFDPEIFDLFVTISRNERAEFEKIWQDSESDVVDPQED
ncbi:MAG: HD domain-containing phosphohydrolase [Candidatus Xenobia bacterium]